MLPSEADLAGDALRVVDDTLPTAPTEALDLTPVVQGLVHDLGSLPVADSDVAALAASMGGDPEAAFAFVRDRIRHDPYPGLLRGATGTLVARAGNALDRASLLNALLVAMGFQVRFAGAELDDATKARVAPRAFDADPGASDTPHATPGTIAAGPLDLDVVASRARRDHAHIRSALGDRIERIGTGQLPDASLVAGRHAWVQIAQDGGWIDLDPTLADAEWGVGLVPAATTFDAFPAADRQSVTLRVVAETIIDGYVEESVALERRLDAATDAGSPILLTFAPDGGGGGLLGGTEATSGYAPLLSVDGTSQLGVAIPVLADGGGFSDLGGFGGGGESDVVSVRFEVTREAPGVPSDTTTRVLLDRVPPDARASGVITSDILLPIVVAQEVPIAFAQLHQIVLSTGGADPRAQIVDTLNAEYTASQMADGTLPEGTSLASLLQPLAALGGLLRLASEGFVVAGLEDDDVRAFVGRPRVYVISLGPPSSEPGAARVQVDLLIDDVAIAPRPGADQASVVPHRLWYGVLQGALETELVRGLAAVSLDPTRSVSAASLGAGDVAQTVLAPDDPAPLPDTLPAALRGDVAAGLVVVVSGDPAGARTWWTISPVDGTTRAVLDPALGGADMWIRNGDYMKMAGGTIWVARTLWLQAQACAPGLESETITRCVGIGSIAPLTGYTAVIITGVVVGIAIGLGVLYLLRPDSPP